VGTAPTEGPRKRVIPKATVKNDDIDDLDDLMGGSGDKDDSFL
jgi:hypothetical protein